MVSDDVVTLAETVREAELWALRETMLDISQRARLLTYLAHEAVMAFEKICLEELERENQEDGERR